MPFPSRLAALRRVRPHHGPKKGRSPIRTLPAFPARFKTRASLLVGSTSARHPRTVDPGLPASTIPNLLGPTCARAWLSAYAQPGVRSPSLRHRTERTCFPACCEPANGGNKSDSGTLQVGAQRYARATRRRLLNCDQNRRQAPNAPCQIETGAVLREVRDFLG